MVSRKDVAVLAGVSPASVSFYVNKSGYVSAAAKERIQKAIDELGYTPNLVARSLKIKDNKQFLFFCNEIRNPFFSELVYRATVAAKKLGYSIIFSCVVDDEDYIRKLCGYQVAGVFAPNTKISNAIIEEIVKKDIPVVLLCDRDTDDINAKVTKIKVDYSHISHDIVAHLKDGNYSNTVYFSGSLSEEEVDDKTASFISAYNIGALDIKYNITSSDKAYRYVKEFYTKESHPDSFCCTNDAVAMGVLKGLHELGLRVPDVAVIGFDNTVESNIVIPGITTVDIDMKEMGNIAIDLLMKKVRGQEAENHYAEPKLIIRESSQRKVI